MSFVDAVSIRRCPPLPVNRGELAIRDLDRGRFRTRTPPARRAWRPLEPHRMTFRTIDQCRPLVRAARSVRLVLGAAILAQAPGDRIVWQTVLKHGTGM